MASKTFMFIAGDPSGDVHAAEVIARLHQREPDCITTGIGGPAMQKSGFTALFPFEPFNKMGYIEVIRHLPFFLSAKKKMITYLKELQPSCLVCVDYSGFNIPMMKAAEKLDIPVVWYIAPMVWAWKKKRAKILGRYASYICCIFPFEVTYFKPFTKKVGFVGNPTVEAFDQIKKPVEKTHQLTDITAIALIPGSRPQEVMKMASPMIEAYRKLKQKYPRLKGKISRFKTLPPDIYDLLLEGTDLSIETGSLTEILEDADIAFVTSGTATLETALLGIPHIIAYKTSPITYAILRHFVSIQYIGLPNIIAEKEIVPEWLQNNVNSDTLFQMADRFLSDATLYKSTCNDLLSLRQLLSTKKASSNVADIIIENSRS